MIMELEQVVELLRKLSNYDGINVSFHRQFAGEKKEEISNKNKIVTTGFRDITAPHLIHYLNERKIPVDIAKLYCKEVDFILYEKRHTTIGFKNNSGGYELRSEYFKGSSSPKDITLVGKPSEELNVFEGFFNFLSFQTQQFQNKKLLHSLTNMQKSFLILNSLSFFEKSRELMEKHQSIHLFLDHDKSGLKCMQAALRWSNKYKDESHYYKGYKDLNECLIQSEKHEYKESHRLKMRH